jgi:hypothetical protein
MEPSDWMDAFKYWMEQYKLASETGDAAVVAALFAVDAMYEETPFAAPMRGREAIFQYWTGASGWIQESRFTYEILGVKANRGIALWQSRITRRETGNQVLLDGVFLVELDDTGLCTRFREWWHRHELPATTRTENEPES